MTAPFPFFLYPTATLTATTTPPLVVQNLDGDGLRIDWTCSKSNKPESDTAEIVIYNLGRPQRELLAALVPVLPAFSFRAVLSVGWGRVATPQFVPPFVLLQGNIKKIVPSRKTRTDVLTIFEIGDSVYSQRDTVTAQVLNNIQGFTWSTAVAAVAAQQGRAVAPQALAAIDAAATRRRIPLTQLRNLNLRSGDLDQVLTDLLETLKLNYVVENDIVHVFDTSGLRLDLPQVVLSASGGLLSYSEEDDGAVSFSALANPLVQPGSQVVVLDELNLIVGGGPLRVERIDFAGSTAANSTMDGIARKFEVI